MLQYFFKLQKITPPLNQYPKLEEFLALRALGWSYMALSDRFGIDKSTVRYICRKFGFHEQVVQVRIFRTTTIMPKSIYNEQEEVINPGKTYAQYLQEAKQRKCHGLNRTLSRQP